MYPRLFHTSFSGRVINISGSQGLASVPGQSAWSAACFAIEGFTDALRMEVAKFGVRVVTIRPGNFVGATGILNRSGVSKLILLRNFLECC